MNLKKLFLAVLLILTTGYFNRAKSQDLIINNNMDSIHCKILAVKGNYYYYKVFIDLKTQVKFINKLDIRDTIRNYYSYEYNRDSAIIVENYNKLVYSKRKDIRALKIGINTGYATLIDDPNNLAIFEIMFGTFGLPHVSAYNGIHFSWIFYKNFGITSSISNIRSNSSGNFTYYQGTVKSTVEGNMKFNNWSYTAGLTYLSTQKRFPKISWQISSELGYYTFHSDINYGLLYDVKSNALLWRNSANVEYKIFKNLNFGINGFIQTSRNTQYEISSIVAKNRVENPKEGDNYHTYFGTTVSLSYLFFNKK